MQKKVLHTNFTDVNKNDSDLGVMQLCVLALDFTRLTLLALHSVLEWLYTL